MIVADAGDGDANQMRQLIDQLRKTASPVAVLLGSGGDGKVTLVAGISRDLEARGLHAGNWIKSAAELVGGRGGG
ncbi:DHHA1 domain-containing protein, partial [Klebsiella pneumoniae]|nr:DHHA1 domain-containing protein [Klebsiella pneumoniae]